MVYIQMVAICRNVVISLSKSFLSPKFLYLATSFWGMDFEGDFANFCEKFTETVSSRNVDKDTSFLVAFVYFVETRIFSQGFFRQISIPH